MKIELLQVLQNIMYLHNVRVAECKADLNVGNVDMGLRKNFYPDFRWEKTVNTFSDSLKENTLYILQDYFEIYYAVFVTKNIPKTAIVIGPYRLTGSSFDEKVYIGKGFKINEIALIREQILKIPHIHEDVITQQLVAVLSAVHLDRKLDIRHIIENAPTEDMHDRFSFVHRQQGVRSMDKVEYRYSIENEVLEAISQGNVTKARKAMKKLTDEDISERYITSVQMQRKSLIILNTLFRKAVEQANVHPYYIDEISYRFFQKIDIVSERREQAKLLEEMLVGYCEYAKKYSAEQYSHTVQKAINHIHINIENKISLNDIAAKLKITPNHLARQFRAETGKTVVEYINYTRVITAANKLKHTSLSVADIAASVGINDTNYFSRIFRKFMGCSPSEYKK